MIYDTYIADDSRFELNIGSVTKKELAVVPTMKDVPQDIFEKAYDEVGRLILADVYPRFRQSRYYRSLLKDKANGDDMLVKELYFTGIEDVPTIVYPQRAATRRRSSVFGGHGTGGIGGPPKVAPVKR